MKTPHKHAELIKAWADGEEIEKRDSYCPVWVVVEQPVWNLDSEYRIKPEPKPDRVIIPDLVTVWVHDEHQDYYLKGELKLTFDGETGKLKSAEVL